MRWLVVTAILFLILLFAPVHGPYVHQIDPIIASVGGVHLWWYGLSYSLGFLNAHVFLRRRRRQLGLSLRDVYDLTLFLAVGVLLGGRSLVGFSNEWPFYRHHLSLIPAIWIGGLATHGLLVGGFAGVSLFCVVRGKPFRPIFDALAIPAALIMGCGRIGNFIDGQIVGSFSDLPWAVKFPEREGFRHPVVLYDGLKNFLLVPLLLWVRRRGVPPGRVAALLVLLYPLLRIPIDLLREYPIVTLGLPTGQTFNILMTIAGGVLVAKSFLWPAADAAALPGGPELDMNKAPLIRRLAFAAVFAAAMVIPSDATRDVPVRYANRHAGLQHSTLYPAIEQELMGEGMTERPPKRLSPRARRSAEALRERGKADTTYVYFPASRSFQFRIVLNPSM